MHRILLLLTITGLMSSGAAAQVTGLEGWNIFLDPGHSVRENMGVYNYSEAEKNLRVALELQDLLLSRTDIDTVYMSRTNDLQQVTLTQRSDLANSLGADWFHSIHSDAASSSSANSTLLLWGQRLNGAEKTPVGGKRMSDIMVDNLTRGMRTTTRGSIGDCSFYRSFITNACSSGGPYLSVNRRTTMASELSEAGFHTSLLQNQRNMNGAWKRLEAWTFYWSILDFWGIPRPTAHIITGFVSDQETGELINGATVSVGGQEYVTDTYDTLFRFYSNDPDQLRNGFYFLEDVGSGPVLVSASADGYRAAVVDLVELEDMFFTFFDVQLVSSTPPIVVSTTPKPDADAFSVVAPIVVEFSRPMDRASVEGAFILEPSYSGRYLWSSDNYRLTFRPDSLPAFTPMTLTISGLAQGALGDPFDGDSDGRPGGSFMLTFTTGSSDTQAPRIDETYPAVRQANVELDPIISIVMDELLDSASIDPNQIEMITASGNPVPGAQTHNDIGDRTVLSFFPADPLNPLTAYIVRITPGLRDLAGNERSTQQQFNFSTGSKAAERSLIDDFESDLESNWLPPDQSGSTTGIVPGSASRTAEMQVVNLGSGSTSALRIGVEWDPGATSTLLREYLVGGAPKSVVFDSSYVLEASVFGDGSETLFRFAVDDNYPIEADGNHEVSPWYTIDWYGWRPISWRPGRDGTGVWIGDGSLDGNLIFDSIQLSRSESGRPSASIVVDDLSLVTPGGVTDIEDVSDLPRALHLMQNYPNPFRGVTKLRVMLPESGYLSVAVYNVLGEEVVRLADEASVSAGTTELSWDATGLPSGVYFARARFEQQVRMVRIVLVK